MKRRTRADLKSWNREIKQVRHAHEKTEAEIWRLRGVLHGLMEKSDRQLAEILRQEAALEAAKILNEQNPS